MNIFQLRVPKHSFVLLPRRPEFCIARRDTAHRGSCSITRSFSYIEISSEAPEAQALPTGPEYPSSALLSSRKVGASTLARHFLRPQDILYWHNGSNILAAVSDIFSESLVSWTWWIWTVSYCTWWLQMLQSTRHN